MYLQEILEVAIGLVFRLAGYKRCNNVLAGMVEQPFSNTRAKELEKTIAQMLSSADMTSQFYDHPLIANLYEPSNIPVKSRASHPISRLTNSARPCFHWSFRPERTVPLSGR